MKFSQWGGVELQKASEAHAVGIIDGVVGAVGSELTVEVSVITPSLVGGVNKEFQPRLHISLRYKQLVNKSANSFRPQDIGVRGNGDTTAYKSWRSHAVYWS